MSSGSFLTANDLRTGQKVFWSGADGWSTDPGSASLAATDAELLALQQVMDRPSLDIEVVGAYIVALDGSGLDAMSPDRLKRLRERRRFIGPSPSTSSNTVSSTDQAL